MTDKLEEVKNDKYTPANTSGLAKDLCIKIDILVQQLSAARTICAFVDSEGGIGPAQGKPRQGGQVPKRMR
jgi:hypothetical protein